MNKLKLVPKYKFLNLNYLGEFIGNGPIDDETNTMSCEESHGDVSKPCMVLDTVLRGEAKEWQQR